VDRQIGVGDSKYGVIGEPLFTGHVTEPNIGAKIASKRPYMKDFTSFLKSYAFGSWLLHTITIIFLCYCCCCCFIICCPFARLSWRRHKHVYIDKIDPSESKYVDGFHSGSKSTVHSAHAQNRPRYDLYCVQCDV